MSERRCSHVKSDGRPCRATPGREAPYCFVHDPEKRRDAEKARRLGGLHRRREKTLKGIYGLGGLTTTEEIRRHVEVAMTDALGLENSVARGRLLIYGAMTAARLLETGELEGRLTTIEAELARLRETHGAPKGAA